MTLSAAVVLSSFTVHPTMPSEPGVGWQFLLATARHALEHDHTVILITIKRSAEAIESALIREGIQEVVKVIPVELPINPTFFRWHKPRFTRFEHLLWTLWSRRLIKRIEREWNLIYTHHVTFATELLPPPIVFFRSTVFRVWGPVGAGGVAEVFEIPPTSSQMRKQALLQRVRDASVRIPAVWSANRVDLILAQNSALKRAVSGSKTEIRVFPNVVVPTMEHNEHVDSTHHRDVDKIRILQIGHFIPRKRIDLGVHSLLEPDLKNAELNLVGEPIGGGPNDILELANSLGIGDRVVFHGKLRRNDVIALMTRMDVLLHTSGREGASGVVGEATTVGLPVVCFKGTGSASVLSQSGASGIVLDPKDGVGTTEIAKAVREAASLPRVQAKIWTVGRVERLVASLYEQARARQRPAA